MYTHEDMAEIERLLKKRWRAAAIPAALVLAAGIALFVVGRMNRSDTMWMATAALTVLGGGYFLFLYGVWVKPARVYRRHVDYMLSGRMRETTGVLKSFSEDVSDREGLECHAMMLNVGERDDPEDDRLFYFDALKPWPGWEAGTRLTVKSNDKLVASIREG